MELPEELKTLIHHILHRHKFYRLEITHYHDILDLLSQPRTEDPHLIQHYVFQGILAFNQAHKDQIAPALANPAFAHVAVDSKALLHRILHEFHFLNCIRAYEMFQERFQQPAALSQPHGLQGLPFNDELEKARLHYMYYGPYSIYSMGGLLPQQPPAYSQPLFAPPANFPEDPAPARTAVKAGVGSERAQQPQRFAPARGRPPKEKKRQQEKLTALKMSASLRQYLLARHGDEQLLEERDEQLQFCVCRGFLNSPHTHICPQCHRHFHVACSRLCLGCAMRDRDPFSRVVETIGMFYLDWWGGDFTFEEQINVKSLERVCSTGRFEVMASCMSSLRDDVTWPDGAVLAVNGQPVFEIPPLLVDHPLAHRRDTAHFVTPYVFEQRGDSQGGFERVKFSLDANRGYSVHFRDNRKDIFLMGLFLVEKVDVEVLMTSVIAESRTALPIVSPLEQESNRHEDLQIDHLAVSCLDPYSRELIETPVRGRHCLHFNCFDLQTFLTFQYHSRERSWRCPLCAIDARNLVIDKFQLRVIEEIRDLPRRPEKVTYHKDGKIDLEEAEASVDPMAEES